MGIGTSVSRSSEAGATVIYHHVTSLAAIASSANIAGRVRRRPSPIQHIDHAPSRRRINSIPL